jgi:hypothetical protein
LLINQRKKINFGAFKMIFFVDFLNKIFFN